MYQSPIPPDEFKQCYECTEYNYDSFHDESWCRKHKWIVEGNGTCENFNSWKEVEKNKIKQQFLFKDMKNE